MQDIIYEGNKYEWEYDKGHIIIRKNGYFLAELFNEGGYQKIKGSVNYISIPNVIFREMYRRKDSNES